jgi:hypothetical protein
MSELTGSDVRGAESAPPATTSEQVESAPNRRRVRGLDALALLVIAATYAVVQYLVFPGPQRFDPSYYFQLGTHFPHVAANWWSLRIGILAPLRLAIAVFGQSQAAQYTLPVVAAVLLAGAVFAMMRMLFHDRLVAIATALVVVLNPNFLLNSAYIFPDTLSTATFAAGLLLVIAGRPREVEPPAWLMTTTVAAGGVLLGWTYLIREFSPILLPVVIAAVLLFRYPVRRMAVLAGAAVATYGVELIYGAVRYGNPFERIHVLLGRKSSSASHHADWAPFREKVHNIVESALVLPHLLLSWNEGWVLVAFIVVFIVALARFRGTRLLVLGAWLFSYWALMAIIGVTHNKTGDPYLDIGNVRYWYPALPALIMGGLGGLALLIRGTTPSVLRVRLSQAAVLVAAALVLVPGTAQFASCANKNVWRNDSAQSWDGVRSFLTSSQAKPFNVIHTDRISVRTLVEYTHSTFGGTVWHGTLGPTSTKNPPLTGAHRLLLVNVASSNRQRAAKLLRTWSPVYVSSDGRLALLAAKPVARPVSAADQQRWLSAYGPRPVVPGTCGSSPYEAA